MASRVAEVCSDTIVSLWNCDTILPVKEKVIRVQHAGEVLEESPDFFILRSAENLESEWSQRSDSNRRPAVYEFV